MITRRALIAAIVLGGIASAAPPPARIVSLIPAVTEMIFAIGEGNRVVGVSNYDRYPPAVETIPRVGGLLDPNVERVLSLKPDLVIVYNTQQELRQRLDRAKIPLYRYEHRALPDIMATLRSVGARIGLAERANQAAASMEADLEAIRRAASREPRVKTLLVFGRDPGSLRNIYASGGYGFLHDMLEAAGGDDVFADTKQQSVQATTEMILARRPEVIVELHNGTSLKSTDLQREAAVWDALPAVPAVRNHRVHLLVGDEFVVPGPRVVDATRALARTLHPMVFK
jgi:iron complex transport system substrate-binding protein